MDRRSRIARNKGLAVAAAALALGIACTPVKPAPAQPAAPASPPVASAPAAAPVQEPPFVYFRLTQAGPRELVVEEVRLDASSAQCFHGQQRVQGAIGFDAGAAQLSETGRKQHEAGIEAVVKAMKEYSRRGDKPSLVLHAYAGRDEAADAQVATELARKRGDAVKRWLVERGVKPEQVRVEVHGWQAADAPLRDDAPLRSMRAVEIASDRTPPSRSIRTEGKAPAADLLAQLQKRVRALEGQGSPGGSAHAPRMLIESRDAQGLVTVQVDPAEASGEARELQRVFMRALADGCSFEAAR